MLVGDFTFSDYYKQFLTIEVDDLSKLVGNGVIQVNEDDAYAVCTAVVDDDGELKFKVLCIGPSWIKCTRGLRNKKFIGEYTLDEVFDCEARLLEPDLALMKKADFKMGDEEVEVIRCDKRLDSLRMMNYPDVVVTSVIHDLSLFEIPTKLIDYSGPFLIGEIVEPIEGLDYEVGDLLYILPYQNQNEFTLIGLFDKDKMTNEEKVVFKKIIDESESVGLSYNGNPFRN